MYKLATTISVMEKVIICRAFAVTDDFLNYASLKQQNWDRQADRQKLSQPPGARAINLQT